MARVRFFITAVIYGFSTFTIAPTSNYYRHIPASAGSITNDAWQMTGTGLSNAMYKIGEQVNENAES